MFCNFLVKACVLLSHVPRNVLVRSGGSFRNFLKRGTTEKVRETLFSRPTGFTVQLFDVQIVPQYSHYIYGLYFVCSSYRSFLQSLELFLPVRLILNSRVNVTQQTENQFV